MQRFIRACLAVYHDINVTESPSVVSANPNFVNSVRQILETKLAACGRVTQAVSPLCCGFSRQNLDVHGDGKNHNPKRDET